MSLNFWRQIDLLNPTEHKEVNIHIIGSGSVGSFLAVTLSKMGLTNIEIWDDDRVESHNIPNQFFMINDIGEQKTVALEKLILGFSNTRIKTHEEKFTKDTELDLSTGTNIVITATDNLESRSIVFEKIKYYPNCTFIDVRMGLEVGRIFTIRLTNIDDLNFYARTLVKKSVELPCTAKAIIYNVLILAGLVANQVKKAIKNEELNKEINFDLKNILFIKSEVE